MNSSCDINKLKYIFCIDDCYDFSDISDLDSYLIMKCLDMSTSELLDFFSSCIERDNSYEQKIIMQFKLIMTLRFSLNDSENINPYVILLLSVENNNIALMNSLFCQDFNNSDDNLNNIFYHINKLSFSDKNKILTKLSKSPHFISKLLYTYLNKKLETSYELNGLLSMFIKPYNNAIDDIKDTIDTNIDHIKPVIDNIMKDQKNLDIFVTYIDNIFTLNDSYAQLHQSQNDLKKCSSITFCISLCKIMLYVFNNLSDTYEETKSYRDKIIHTLLHSIKVSVIPLKRIKESLIKQIKNNQPDIFSFFPRILDQNNSLNDAIIIRKIKKIESIQNDINLTQQIDKSMKQMITDSNKNNTKTSDDFIVMLNDLLSRKLYEGVDVNLEYEEVMFLFKVISSEIESNKHIRFTSCLIVLKYCEINGYAKLYENKKIDFVVGLTSLLKFISNVNYFEIIQPPVVYTFHQNLLCFVNYHYDKLKKYNKTILENNLYDTALYKIVSYANKFIFDIMIICKDIDAEFKQYNFTSLQITNLRQKLVPIILEYIRNCMTSIQTLCNFMTPNIILNNNLSDESILSLSNFIYSTIEYLSDGKGIIYNVLHMNMETKDLLCELYILLNIACDNKQFTSTLVDKIHLIKQMCHIVKVNITLQTELLDKLDNIEKNNVINDDLPHEFCDPFLYTEIMNPVMIPNCSDFFDRLSIMSHLRLTPLNPITSEYLSVDEFNDFNHSDHVKQLINDFNERKSNYKILNNK